MLGSVLFLPTLTRTFRFLVFFLPTYLDMLCFGGYAACLPAFRTRTRTNTNPYDTKANAAGFSGVFLLKDAASQLPRLPTNPVNLYVLALLLVKNATQMFSRGGLTCVMYLKTALL